MKKRIIALILAVVTLALSLVGCAYNYAKDDLSEYVEYNETLFKNALESLQISGADFYADAANRDKVVHDTVYAALASATPSSTDKVSTGKAGAYDKVFYCYYATFKNDKGEVIQLASTYMTAPGSTKASLQLGLNKYSSTFVEKVSAAISEFAFSETVEGTEVKNAYAQVTSGKPVAGQIAFVSYTYEYTDAENAKQTGKVANQMIVLNGDMTLDKALMEKEITKSVDKVVIPAAEQFAIKGADVNYDVTITEAKVNYVVEGKEIVIEDETYTTAAELETIYGEKNSVSGTITYHVYPVSYQPVYELNTANVIAHVFGKSFTKDIAKSIIFGVDFAEKTEEEQNAAIAAFTVKGISATEGSTVFDTVVDKLVEALSDYATKKTSFTSAETAYNNASEETKAEKKTAYDNAKKALDEAEQKRDELIAALITRDYQSVLDAKAAYVKAQSNESEKQTAYEATDLYKDMTTKKQSYNAAKQTADTAKKTMDDKKAAWDKAADADKATAEAAYNEAVTAYNTAATAETTAKEAYDAAVAANVSDAKTAYEKAVNEAADAKAAYEAKKNPTGDAIEPNNASFIDGYKKYTYKKLENEYNKTIKDQLAEAIVKVLENDTYLKVVGYPKKAVDQAYEMLMDNYRYSFYKGTAADSDGKEITNEDGQKVTNYTYYSGSFNLYLVAAVSNDITSVDSFAAAKEAVRAKAQEQVDFVLRYSFIAAKLQEANGDAEILFTNKDYKNYKKENKTYYQNIEYYYGDNAETLLRNGLQFERLMNYLLTSTEKKENGMVEYTYENIVFKTENANDKY